MKAFKKQIRRLRSRTASTDSSLVPAEDSNILVPNTKPNATPSDPNTLQMQSKDTDAVALEVQHMDSDMHKELVSDPVSLEPHSDNLNIPNVQMKASVITNVMQHVDPDLMKKFGRFRILVIGRANAGKTTILQQICNSTEDPEIYSDQGEKVLLTRLGYHRY